MTEDTVLHLRVNKTAIESFNSRARGLGMKPSDALRLLIDAFNNGRMTIVPTEEQLELFGESLNTTDKE